jgi:hypothetical protein
MSKEAGLEKPVGDFIINFPNESNAIMGGDGVYYHYNDICQMLKVHHAEKSEQEIKRVYDWLMDENREPAQTKFTAGETRNLAREIEFRIHTEKTK